jgi:hypothetical protein
MTPEEAIRFLEAHQPMPADADATEDLIREFDEARRSLEHHRDPRTARLLLNALGEGDGLGVYQLLDETLRTLPRGDVVEALAQSLRSRVRSVRAWSMEMALDYPDRVLVPHATGLLGENDRDQRAFAAHFLAMFGGHDRTTVASVRAALAGEDDEEIRGVLQAILSSS